MARKYTRKQLKQPDEFITLAHRTWDWITDHATRVLAALVACVVVIALAWTWSYLSERKAQKRTTLLSKALDIDTSSLVPEGTVAAPTENGTPRFATQKRKLDAAAKAFTDVVKRYASSEVGALATLMRATVHYEQERYADAATDYEHYLEQDDRDDVLPFRDLAIEGLVRSYTGQKKWSEALRALAKLPREGDKRFTAMYLEAWVHAAKGDQAKAAKLFREIAARAGSSSVATRATQQLALLDHGS